MFRQEVGLTEYLVGLFMLFCWLADFVLAKGFWSTLACFFPFYAWYLVTERVLQIWSFV